MFKFLLNFSILIFQAFASGEFSILHSPSSLDFKGTEKLNAAVVGDVLAAGLGHSVLPSAQWSGLYINDPFNIPTGVVFVLVDGVKHINVNKNAKTYPLTGDFIHESLNALTTNLEEQNFLAVDLDLSQGLEALSTYSDILDVNMLSKTKSSSNLKPDIHSEDKLLLEQIQVLDSIAENIPEYGKLPKLLLIRLTLEPLEFAHGPNSLALSDAVKLLSQSIQNLSQASDKAYKSNLIFAIATTNHDVIRTKRQAKDTIDDLNLAKPYSKDYPAIFNIILWFGVVFTFSLLAIAYAIATMDPGRDSIIYRMTSTRMKKEN